MRYITQQVDNRSWQIIDTLTGARDGHYSEHDAKRFAFDDNLRCFAYKEGAYELRYDSIVLGYMLISEHTTYDLAFDAAYLVSLDRGDEDVLLFYNGEQIAEFRYGNYVASC